MISEGLPGVEGDAPTEVSFSFGENWLDFLKTLDDDVRATAVEDLDRWLGLGNIVGRSVIDIGSGSGLSSFAFRQAGCGSLTSVDVDPLSVEATQFLANQHPDLSNNWTIRQASILDSNVVSTLGQFEIVYSWGVLHHTGQMWTAIENAARLCADGGVFWISIYQAGPHYDADLRLKKAYNAAGPEKKKLMERVFLQQIGYSSEEDLLAAEQDKGHGRGMNVFHDVIDWLGGLPYEVARPSEILFLCHTLGFEPLRVMEVPEGGCSIYLLRKSERSTGDTPFDYVRERDKIADRRTLRQQHTDELNRADAAYVSMKHELEERFTLAERGAAQAEGRLNSGTHIARAIVRRVGRTFGIRG